MGGTSNIPDIVKDAMGLAQWNSLTQAFGNFNFNQATAVVPNNFIQGGRDAARNMWLNFGDQSTPTADGMSTVSSIPLLPSADYWLWSSNRAFTTIQDPATPAPFSIVGRLYRYQYRLADQNSTNFDGDVSRKAALNVVATVAATNSVQLVRANAIDAAFQANANTLFTAMNADPSTIINTVAARLITASTVQRDREVARMQRMSSVVNGFFNTKNLARVTEINNQYQIELNKTLAELTGDMYKVHKQLALGVIQALSGWTNRSMEAMIEANKTSHELIRQYYVMRNDLNNTTTETLGKGWAYAQAQAQKWMVNTQQRTGATGSQLKWEAEYFQALSNVSGQRESSGNPFMQQLLGMAQIAAGIGGTSLGGPAGGTVAGAVVGAIGKSMSGS
jgi:hypothetical protein